MTHIIPTYMTAAIQLCSAAPSLRFLDVGDTGNEWPSYAGRDYPQAFDRMRRKP
jgi:hypothetical protein